MPNPILVTHGAGHRLSLLTVTGVDIRQTGLIMFLLSNHHTSTYYFYNSKQHQNQLNMHSKNITQKDASLITDDDLFQEIISSKDINFQVENAWRNSMRARGDKNQEVNSDMVWPLCRQTHISHKIQEMMEERYGLQGVLEKESPNFFGGWSLRYTILKGHRFVYKQNSSPMSPNAGILNFNLLSCQIAMEVKNNVIDNFRIFIKNTNKQFVFRGRTTRQTELWYHSLAKVAYQNQGVARSMDYIAQYPRFWRKDCISEAEFRKDVQPGDILLFRGMKDTSVMQRAVTMDQYDHVAVVLLNQMGQPLIFQANGGVGVGICPWIKFIEKKWWKQYQIIVHRKLRTNRTPQFLAIIEQFVGKNMGKQYDFSLTDYLFQRTSSADKDHVHYFCSSLVAKLYKRLGLLPDLKSCKQYLPSSFASKYHLYLMSSGPFGYAFLEEQKIIVFDDSLSKEHSK